VSQSIVSRYCKSNNNTLQTISPQWLDSRRAFRTTTNSDEQCTFTFLQINGFNFPLSESIIHFDSSRNLYQFSPPFDHACNDINNYTYAFEFYAEFPDLVDPDYTLSVEMRLLLRTELKLAEDTTVTSEGASGSGHELEEQKYKHSTLGIASCFASPYYSSGFRRNFNNDPSARSGFNTESLSWALNSM